MFRNIDSGYENDWSDSSSIVNEKEKVSPRDTRDIIDVVDDYENIIGTYDNTKSQYKTIRVMGGQGVFASIMSKKDRKAVVFDDCE